MTNLRNAGRIFSSVVVYGGPAAPRSPPTKRTTASSTARHGKSMWLAKVLPGQGCVWVVNSVYAQRTAWFRQMAYSGSQAELVANLSERAEAVFVLFIPWACHLRS